MKIHFTILTILLLIITACSKNEPAKPPMVETLEISNITLNSAKCSGLIIGNNKEITEVGLCWSKSSDPTIEDFIVSTDFQDVEYIFTIPDLEKNTTYYARAYAISDAGIGYGDVVSFTTLDSYLVDIDGNRYNTLLIGTQVWLDQNLKTTRFSNGDIIPDKYHWAYDNNENIAKDYGRLYSWNITIDERNVCPDGWHVPSFEEWQELITYIGGFPTAGNKLKEAGTQHWFEANSEATNEYGFSALPSGERGTFFNPEDYFFMGLGVSAYWWSSSSSDNNGIGLYATAEKSDVGIVYTYSKLAGFSIRCIAD